MVHVEYEGIWSYSASWDGTRHNERPGGEVAAMCDAHGHPSSELPSAEATMAAGAHVGDYARARARATR